MLVGSCCLGGLIRGLQNLGTPCKGERFYSFRLYEKNGEYPRGLRPSGLPGTIQSSAGNTFGEASDGTCRTRFFAQNGGEKALNRCEVPVLQREDLERTAKEWPCSLRTVGYGWAGICGVGCGNWRRLRTVKWLVRIGGVLVAKKACFFSSCKTTWRRKAFGLQKNSVFSSCKANR